MVKLSSLSLKSTIGMFLVLSMLLGGFAYTANAASSCKTRASVSAAEAKAITGVSGGAVASGSTLSLTGPAAGENALVCGFALIKWVANVVFAVLMSIAVLMIAYAAFLFVTAGDKPQSQQRAKKVMLWAIVGLLVASIARLIPNIAQSIMGFS